MKLRSSLCAFGLLLAPTLAHAQGKGALAETAYNDGRDLYAAGQVAAACAKFQSSMDLDPQRSTLQALAVCREKEEKWASAWQNYLELGRQFSRSGDEEKAQMARGKAGELEKKLLYVVLVMDAPPPGLSITLDGTTLDASLLGSRLPVDPGAHDIVVTATNKKPWKQRVTVGPSPSEQQVKIAALEDAPASEGGGAGNYAMPGPMQRQHGFWTTQRAIGAAVGGAGVLAMGGAAVFQVVALSSANQRDKITVDSNEPNFNTTEDCKQGAPVKQNTGCPTRASRESHDAAANKNQIAAIVLVSAGGAMVITGVVLLVTGGHKETATATWKPKAPPKALADFSMTPVAGPQSVGLVGTF